MATWQQQWEEILIQKLEERGIGWEKTSFSITPDVKLYRENEWEEVFKSGQIMEALPPWRKGAEIVLKAHTSNNLPVAIGDVMFYDNNKTYHKGIVCQLITKDLKYGSGEIKNCLAFDQGVILVDVEEIPVDILENKTLKLKLKGEQMKNSGGCFGTIFFAFIILMVIHTVSSLGCTEPAAKLSTAELKTKDDALQMMAEALTTATLENIPINRDSIMYEFGQLQVGKKPDVMGMYGMAVEVSGTVERERVDRIERKIRQ